MPDARTIAFYGTAAESDANLTDRGTPGALLTLRPALPCWVCFSR